MSDENGGNFFSFLPRTSTVRVCFLLRRLLDEIEPRQVNARKRLVLDVPLFELFLRKPQVENLQPVLHLEIPRQNESFSPRHEHKKEQRNNRS